MMNNQSSVIEDSTINRDNVVVVRGPRGPTGERGMSGPVGPPGHLIPTKKLVLLDNNSEKVELTGEQLKSLLNKIKELEERILEIEDIWTYAPGAERLTKVEERFKEEKDKFTKKK